jgi:hypothetical protein
MAPSAVPIEGVSHIDDEECGRTTKRIKLAATAVLIENDVEDGSITIPSHPLGIRPSGNAYTASHDIKTACGPFSRIPDELLITLLEGLDAQDLVRLGTTCKAFYAFTRLEELWRSLFIVYVYGFDHKFIYTKRYDSYIHLAESLLLHYTSQECLHPTTFFSLTELL